MTAAFGVLAPSFLQKRVRAIGHKLPPNYFGRKAASILLGPAGGRSRRSFDVSIFGSQRARLHPFDNICEKRVFLTPQLWDRAERALLGDIISNFGGRTFRFADIGANVGLYTLFARAEALRADATFKAACIEADPEMAARLRFNIEASGAVDDVAVFECAASDADKMLNFSINRDSRGLSRIDEAGETRVTARPLLAILREAGFERIDAMKIDIEGHEFPALSAFLRDAPRVLWPSIVILEVSHSDAERSAEGLLSSVGYGVRLRTKRNAVLVRGDQTPG